MESSGRFIHLDPPDEALCARVAERDVAAFEALYDRYRDRVYAWAAHVLGPRQAEDTTQEVFALLWRRAGQFNPSRGQFTQWFWALTRNHILRDLRGISRQKRTQIPDQRRVLIMSYFVGLSHSAIAEELSLPLGTVKKRARLGMQKLREALIADETSVEPIQHKEVRPDERR